MAFHPLGNLLQAPPAKWEESDLRYFVEQYLRQWLHSDAIYCDQVRGGVALVRASTATLRQMVLLLEYDVRRELKQHTGQIVERLTVRQ